MRQGRSITGENIERLLEGLRQGMTRRAAAAYAGFGKTALYRMIETDEGTLRTAIEKAEGEAEAVYTALVAQAAVDPKNWTAAAWWLERRHPSDFGRRVEVTMNLRELATRVAGNLNADDVMAEAERILAEAQ